MNDPSELVSNPEGTTKIDSGKVLTRAFSIYGRNFVPFTLIMLIVLSPALLWTAVMFGKLDPATFGLEFLSSLQTYSYGSAALTILLQSIATGAIVFGTFYSLKEGSSPDMGRCLQVGLSKLGTVLIVGLLAGLAVLGGLILLIIPGLILSVALVVAVPAAVVDSKRPVDALKYSFELTKGSRWAIFGVLFAIGMIQNLVPMLYQKLFLDQSSVIALISSLKTYIVLQAVFTLVGGALSAVAASVIFHDLKVSKEGADAETLIRVFE